MKHIMLASALVSLTAIGALAQSAQVGLPAALQYQILTLVPNADLTNLTNAQYAQLVTLFSNSDDLGAGENSAGAIKAILNAQ